MTTGAEKWLPVGKPAANEVKSRLDRAIGDWSRAWFSKPFSVTSNLMEANAGAPNVDDGAGWRLYGREVSINIPRRAGQRLLDRALDLRLNQLVLTDTDHRLLDIFERRMIGALISKIENALDVKEDPREAPVEAPAPFSDRGGMIFALGEPSGGPLFWLGLPLKTVLPLILDGLAPPRPSSEQFAPLTKALGPAPVTIEANLGRAELRLSELKDLAPGDVLVLDAALNDPVEVSLPGGASVFARATLAESAGQMTLVFQPRR